MHQILVAGVAGFIGSKVAELFLAQGYHIIGVDNLNDAYDVRLKHWRLQRLLNHPQFTFRVTDVKDAVAIDELGRTLPKVQAVFNLAACAGVRHSVEHPKIFFDTNTCGTLNLLELCRRKGVKKFVLASTSSLYNHTAGLPFHEALDTSHPLSPYAASKKAAEVLSYTYHYLYKLDVTILRYFTVYGPAGRPDMSPFRFVQWVSEGRPVTIYGDGQQLRDFTYVDDIARGTLATLAIPGYEVINLGSNRPIKLLDALSIIEKKVGRPAKIVFKDAHAADIPATWADITLANRLLGWLPQVDFETGIERTVAWYQAEQTWARSVSTD